jgi:hypothetical protein
MQAKKMMENFAILHIVCNRSMAQQSEHEDEQISLHVYGSSPVQAKCFICEAIQFGAQSRVVNRSGFFNGPVQSGNWTPLKTTPLKIWTILNHSKNRP